MIVNINMSYSETSKHEWMNMTIKKVHSYFINKTEGEVKMAKVGQGLNQMEIENINYVQIFEGIFEKSPNGIVVADKDLYIKLFNENAEILTGLKREDVVDHYFHAIFPQIPQLTIDEKNILDKNMNTAIINGKSLHTKVFMIRNLGELIGVVFMMQDLSEVIKLTTELEKSQHIIGELEDILEGSFDGVLVTDGTGKVLMVNKSYERITSIKKEEMLGRNMKELINPVWMKNSVVFLAIEEKKPISLPHITRHQKNVIVTGTPIFNKKGEVKKVVVNARDISEIYELREELLKAQGMEKLYFKNLSDLTNKKGQHSNIVIVSEAIQEIFSLAHKVCNFDATVLILGESGVGKEEVAKYIHNNSLRKDKPFVVINCGAIPEHLLESELFGYEKGAFTGASREGKIGLYEAANGGSIFLDEIGEMSLSLQVKLLRVLETRQINRVGSVKMITVDVRVIAATNKNLEARIQSREFREDLYYRLNVIQLNVPPLRDRVEDIAPLALHFLHLFNSKYGQNKKMTYDVIKKLEEYSWLGNIRQLKNMLESVVILSNNEYIQINDFPWYKEGYKNTLKTNLDSEIIPLEQAVVQTEKKLLENAKEKYKSSRKIAQVLEIDQSTVVRKMKKYGLTLTSDEKMQN